jgi:hypothetical protein
MREQEPYNIDFGTGGPVEPVGCFTVISHLLINSPRLLKNVVDQLKRDEISRRVSIHAHKSMAIDAFLNNRRPWDHALCSLLGIPLIDRSKIKDPNDKK